MRVLRPFVSGLTVASLVVCVQAVDSEAVSGAEAASRPVQVLTPGARLHFEPTGDNEQFVTRGAGYSLHLGASASTLRLAPAKPSREAPRPTRPEPVVLRFRLVGADADARVEASEALPGRSHYFRGADPSRWRHDVPHFGRVTYREVYPGTDLTFYGTAGALEHDFVVAPGSDPGRIRLGIEGASALRIDEAGDLVVTTALGDVRQKAPVAYQVVDGERRGVASGYVLEREGEVAFRVGPYEGDLPLVIDPVLTYATFLGGSARTPDRTSPSPPTGRSGSPAAPSPPISPDPAMAGLATRMRSYPISPRTGGRSWAPHTSVALAPISRTASRRRARACTWSAERSLPTSRARTRRVPCAATPRRGCSPGSSTTPFPTCRASC